MTSESQQPHPRGRTFGPVAVVLAAIAGAAIAGGGVFALTRPAREQAPAAQATQAHAEAEHKDQYQCPMHPSIVEDHPGTCPICGMNLVKVETAPPEDGAPAGPGERKILFYRSPMDPNKTSPVPAKDEMGMDYVPVYADEVEGGKGPEGLAQVRIDPARQQLIGLRTTEVTRGEIGGRWRTVGKVAFDETRVRRINVKVGGFAEKVFVNFTGQEVRKGEPLFTIYSPELYSAQQEYLLALQTQKRLAEAGGLAENGDALVASARRRLQLWDIPQSELRRLEKSGEPSRTLTLYSPISGVVVNKAVVEGARLDPGAMPYEIVDLSEVWVLADIYETDLRFVKVGMPATLKLKAYPNRPFKGKVAFLDPVLDPKTRTVKVRVAFPNPTGELRPEMFGEVTLHGTAREALRVASDALIDSGTQKVVFLSLGDGKFAPRAVEVGASDGDQVEVVSGLRAGDRVVSRANFLIDSESRLKSSLAALASSAPKQQPKQAAPSAGQDPQ